MSLQEAEATIERLQRELQEKEAELTLWKTAVEDWRKFPPEREVRPTGDSLVDRLRGIYSIPINDRAGPLDGKNEYVGQGFFTGKIMYDAAEEIERLRKDATRPAILTADEEKELAEILAKMTPGEFETGGDAKGQVWSALNGLTVAMFPEVHKPTRGVGFIDAEQRWANQQFLVLASKFMRKLVKQELRP